MTNNLMITKTDEALTMSSVEIAELTGKKHFHVKRDIGRMLDELGQDASKFGGIYRDAYGRRQTCYHLPKKLSLTLVAGYSAVLRSRIVDRWVELEAKHVAASTLPTMPVLSSRAATLRALADEYERHMADTTSFEDAILLQATDILRRRAS